MERLKFILKVIGIAVLGAGFIASLGVIISNQYGISNAPTILLSTINVIALVSLAFFTYSYMKSTTLMAGVMQEQRVIASQPFVIQKAMYEKDVFEGSTSEYFYHFIIWNAGNGPAIELVYSLLNEQKSSIHSKRVTFLRTNEETTFIPEVRLEEGKYYLVCQYMNISRLTGKESVNQTWLPFEVHKATKEGKVYVAPGKLLFKFDVGEGDLLDVFSRSSKPQ